MPTPVRINRHGDHDIEIEWDNNQTVVYPSRFLRLSCPCAVCEDEVTGKRIVHDSMLPILTYPTKIEPVGRYAIQIFWSDSHSTGLFTWEKLWDLATKIEDWKAGLKPS
jgi:DUF971 family protein